MRTSLLATSFLMALLTGCVHQQPVQTTFDPPYPERNGAGEPIVATFFGRIPCVVASCEMRKVELVLYGREVGKVPTTYWLGQVGVGSGNDRIVEAGTWAAKRGVQGYPEGVVYALDSPNDRSLQYLWRVNDEVLLILGRDMQPTAGNAAWGNMLSRDCAPYGPKTYSYDKHARRFATRSLSQGNCVRESSPVG